MKAILSERDQKLFQNVGGKKGKRSPISRKLSIRAKAFFKKAGRLGGLRRTKNKSKTELARIGALGGKPRKYRPCHKAPPARRGRHAFYDGVCSSCKLTVEQVRLT